MRIGRLEEAVVDRVDGWLAQQLGRIGDAQQFLLWGWNDANRVTGVVPEERRTPAQFMLLSWGGLRYFEDAGFEELVVALVTEEFRLFERVAEPTREYALYARPVG